MLQRALRLAQHAQRSVTTVGAADAARRLRAGSPTGKIPPTGMEKLQRVQDEIDEATDVMRQNIEQVVGRGEHLELLVDKSDNFSANAARFHKDSSHLRKAMWWKNMRTILMLVTIMLFVGLAVGWFKCGWMFEGCRKALTL